MAWVFWKMMSAQIRTRENTLVVPFSKVTKKISSRKQCSNLSNLLSSHKRNNVAIWVTCRVAIKERRVWLKEELLFSIWSSAKHLMSRSCFPIDEQEFKIINLISSFYFCLKTLQTYNPQGALQSFSIKKGFLWQKDLRLLYFMRRNFSMLIEFQKHGVIYHYEIQRRA